MDRALPDALHQHLLEAATAGETRALEGWRAFLAAADLDRLDAPAQRLLPLVFKNLSGIAPADAALAIARRFQVLAWVKNQRLLHGSRPVLQDLLDSGIEFRILKGGALAAAVYGDWAARPMCDLDVYVRRSDLTAVLARLAARGFRSARGSDRSVLRSADLVHACGFLHDSQAEIDVHWHALFECCYEESDRELWDAVELVRVAGLSVPALRPTENLLLICAHGYQSCLKGSFRQVYWVADALALIAQRGADVDWPRLLELARTRDLLFGLARALAYLADRHQASVPPEIRRRLTKVRPSRIERLERTAVALSQHRARTLALFLCQYLRGTRRPELRGPSGLIRYLRSAWELDRNAQVPGALLEKLARNLRELLAAGP